MCRPKEEGGRRCPAHSAARRRTGRAAVRLYRHDTPRTRAAVENLPPEFVYGTIAERAHVVATTTNMEVVQRAKWDPKKTVRDACLKNPTSQTLARKNAREKNKNDNARWHRKIRKADAANAKEAADLQNTMDTSEPKETQKREEDESLFASPDPIVRQKAFIDGCATQDYPETLDTDPSVDVRASLAKWSTDPDRLARLAVDSDHAVRKTAYRNQYHRPIRIVGETVAERRACFLGMHERGEVWLDDYANSSVTEVRTVVASQTKTPEILDRLTTDRRSTVRKAALKNKANGEKSDRLVAAGLLH